MASESVVDKIVAEFIDNHPGITSKHMYARMLYNEYPQMFTDKEHARLAVRRITGAKGKHSVRRDSQYFRELEPSKFGFPEPVGYKPHEAYHLPASATNILLMSDIHVPFQDQTAVDVAVEYGRKAKVNTVILLGDIFDFFNASDFTKDPRTVHPKVEKEVCVEWLETLRKAFPKALIIFKLGNHEHRYEKYWWKKAPEMLDIVDARFENVYQLERLGIICVHNKAQIRASKVTLIHGHEFPRNMWGTSPKHPATSYWTKFVDNVIGADKHRTDYWPVRTGRGHDKGAWCLGCLCDLEPEYASTGNQWNHGFGHLTIEKNGDFNMRNLRIIKGKVDNG